VMFNIVIGSLGVLLSILFALLILYGCVLVTVGIIGELEWWKSRKLKKEPRADD